MNEPFLKIQFGHLPVGAIFRRSKGKLGQPGDVRYQKVRPVQIGPQVFCVALVDEADVVKVFGDDAGPGWPYHRVPPYVPRSGGRAHTYEGIYHDVWLELDSLFDLMPDLRQLAHEQVKALLFAEAEIRQIAEYIEQYGEAAWLRLQA